MTSIDLTPSVMQAKREKEEYFEAFEKKSETRKQPKPQPTTKI